MHQTLWIIFMLIRSLKFLLIAYSFYNYLNILLIQFNFFKVLKLNFINTKNMSVILTYKSEHGFVIK